jgi:hypothetical protein
MKLYTVFAVLFLCSGFPVEAQQQRERAPAKDDSAFRALQERGKNVMGVDQYTSSHTFEALPDGGRITLQRDVDDSVGVGVIRTHMQDVARRFTGGDFSLSEAVHGTHQLPGVDSMRALRSEIRFIYSELPRGGEVRLTTSNGSALHAIHEFLAFQRSDHRSHSKH